VSPLLRTGDRAVTSTITGSPVLQVGKEILERAYAPDIEEDP
jgi:hypothetical protein